MSEQSTYGIWNSATPRLGIEQAQNWSRIVAILRLGFPSLAIFLGVVFVVLMAKSAIENGLNGQKRLAGQEVVTMVKPRFTGRDTSGNLYTIVADAAQRRYDGSALIDLVEPVFVDAFGSEVTAPVGVFDRKLGELNLSESVVMQDSEGYRLNSDNAVFLVAERKLVGKSPLKGAGPLGKVQSNSYQVLEEGARIELEGDVQMLLYNGIDADIAEGLAPRFEDLDPIDYNFGQFFSSGTE